MFYQRITQRAQKKECSNMNNHEHHGSYPPPPSPPTPPTHGSRYISGGLLFIFSFLFPPGANYMFMGLIKRGLTAMCGFFLLIFMITAAFTSGSWMIGLMLSLMMPVYILTCIFDGFNIRRRLNAGEFISDDMSGVIQSILQNRTLTIIILALIVITFAGTILGVAFSIIRRLIPLAIIVFGLYVVFRRKKDKPE